MKNYLIHYTQKGAVAANIGALTGIILILGAKGFYESQSLHWIYIWGNLIGILICLSAALASFVSAFQIMGTSRSELLKKYRWVFFASMPFIFFSIFLLINND